MSDEMTRKQFESRLIQRAETDEAFRKLLLSDSKQAIKEEFVEQIPHDIDIYVHEEKIDTYHFVIPWNPFTIPDDELSDENLELISGGTYDCTGVVLATAMCTMNKNM